MRFLQRLWLFTEGYCWPHTILYCADCRNKRRAIADAKNLAVIRRKDAIAYEIRLRRMS